MDHRNFDNWIGKLGNYKADYIYNQFFIIMELENEPRDFLTAASSPQDVNVYVVDLNDTSQSVGKRLSTYFRKFWRIFTGSCLSTSLKLTLALALEGSTVLNP